MDQPFFQQRFEVRLVQALSHRNLHAVPTIVTRFVAAQQQDGTAPWVKRIQDAQRTALMLHRVLGMWARARAPQRPPIPIDRVITSFMISLVPP